MKELWKKTALGAVALVCAGAANAYVIDFENTVASGAPYAPLLSDGDYVTQGGYAVIGQDGNNTTNTPDGTLVGAMVNGADPTSCLDGVCAAGNTSHYVAALDNGIISVQGGTTPLVLSSFSAAFLPAAGVTYPSTLTAYLAVEADRADGSYAVGLFSLLGPNATTGLTTFASFSTAAGNYLSNGGTGTIISGNITALYFYAYYCAGTCSAFTSDKGQFALDNINLVTAVPEPSEWLLMALGLAGVGAVVRRRTDA